MFKICAGPHMTPGKVYVASDLEEEKNLGKYANFS